MTDEEWEIRNLKNKIRDLERTIESLQNKLDKKEDVIFKKDCEISRLKEYESRCQRNYDSWVVNKEIP